MTYRLTRGAIFPSLWTSPHESAHPRSAAGGGNTHQRTNRNTDVRLSILQWRCCGDLIKNSSPAVAAIPAQLVRNARSNEETYSRLLFFKNAPVRSSIPTGPRSDLSFLSAKSSDLNLFFVRSMCAPPTINLSPFSETIGHTRCVPLVEALATLCWFFMLVFFFCFLMAEAKRMFGTKFGRKPSK